MRTNATSLTTHIRAVSTSPRRSQVVLFVEPGRVSIADPSTRARTAVLPLLHESETLSGTGTYLECETANSLDLARRIGTVVKTRTWSRANQTEAWLPSRLSSDDREVGPILTTWVDEPQLILGDPARLLRLVDGLHGSGEFKLDADSVHDLHYLCISQFNTKNRPHMISRITQIGRLIGMEVATARTPFMSFE